MFDGADLNAAYGTSLSPMDSGSEGNQFLLAAPSNGLGQLPPPPQSSVTHEPPVTAPAATSHAMPPEVPYTPPSAMYVHHPAPQRNGYTAGGNGDSMWDKLSSKKYDVLKLVILSLVILLAMSSDRVVNFYLMKYINGGIFTTVQEFLVRLSYPLGVLVILWVIKASSS